MNPISYQNSEGPVILLPTNKGVRIIATRQIIRIQSIGSYSKLFFDDCSTLVVSKVLRYFELMLPGQEFIRVHRKHIVNRQYTQTIVFDEGAKIVLGNGELLNISRRKRKAVLARFDLPVLVRA
jgi:two-component system, LytTR family, response regulator